MSTSAPTAERQRPSIVNEVRAWLLVGITLLVNIVGGVWWAATLSAEIKALREMLGRLELQVSTMAGAAYTAAEARRDLEHVQRQLTDHEARLRQLERPPARAGGGLNP